MTNFPPTKRQLDIFRILVDYYTKNFTMPSHREIGETANISSLSVVNRHLVALEEKGFIERQKGRQMAIRLLKNLDGSARI